MRNFVISSFAVLAMLSFAPNANATICNMADCAVAVTVDSGTGQNCNQAAATYCNCAQAVRGDGACFPLIRATSPGAGYYWYGYTVGATGSSSCWGTFTGCRADQTAKEEIAKPTAVDKYGVAHAFSAEEASPLVDNFYGYENAILRSSNTGRSISVHARLDVCLYYTDVDTVTSTGWNATGETSCETYCGNGSQNEYCNQNSAAVCKDRCRCLYQYNGVGGLTCQNL